MRIRIITATLAGIVVAAAATPSFAQSYGPSNFGAFTYPSHSCGAAPVVPIRQRNMTSVLSVDDYNREVDAYNSRLQVYSDCIRTYVEGARNDSETIRRKAEEASATLESQPRVPR